METNTNLENLVLMTLSFFEPMTFSQIILDFDNDQLKNYPQFDKETLQEILVILKKKKLIKEVKIDKEMGWIKVQRKRVWWKRILHNFF